MTEVRFCPWPGTVTHLVDIDWADPLGALTRALVEACGRDLTAWIDAAAGRADNLAGARRAMLRWTQDWFDGADVVEWLMVETRGQQIARVRERILQQAREWDTYRTDDDGWTDDAWTWVWLSRGGDRYGVYIPGMVDTGIDLPADADTGEARP